MIYDEEWYNSLAKPKMQPPIWIFAPVWLFIYILMAVSFALILLSTFRWINIFAYLLFVVQIYVNRQWAPAFFREHNLRKAFLISALLTLLVFLTMVVFFHISKLAGLMFFIYFLWCLFATALSFQILELNEW